MRQPPADLRAPGEPLVPRYDPDIHPGIVLRLCVAGETPDRIAHHLGLDLREYGRWLREHKALRLARDLAQDCDRAVQARIFEVAMGWRNPDTGKLHPPNPGLLKFWAKARMGWSEEPRTEQQQDLTALSREELAERVRDLHRAIDRTAALPPPDQDPGF